VSQEVFEAANRLLAVMPLPAAVRLTRRLHRRAGVGRPDRRRWWARVHWQIEDIYAARLSGAEPKPLEWPLRG
jgi:hypothetical protein